MEMKKLGMWVGLATAATVTVFVIGRSNQTNEAAEAPKTADVVATQVAAKAGPKLVTNNFVPAISVREDNGKSSTHNKMTTPKITTKA